MVYDRADRGDSGSPPKIEDGGESIRPVRDQRSFCGCDHGSHQRAPPGPGPSEHSWWRGRPRPSDRSQRSTHSYHAAPCIEAHGREARHREFVYRWRRSCRPCGGTLLVNERSLKEETDHGDPQEKAAYEEITGRSDPLQGKGPKKEENSVCNHHEITPSVQQNRRTTQEE